MWTWRRPLAHSRVGGESLQDLRQRVPWPNGQGTLGIAASSACTSGSQSAVAPKPKPLSWP